MAPEAQVLLAAVAAPFLAAALVPFAYRVLGEYTAYAGAAVAAICFGLIATQFGTHGSAGYEWIPYLSVSLEFYVDGLSLLVGFLASGVGVLIFTYSKGYMHDEPGQAKYYASLLVFMGSMLGLVFSADLLSLFVFWELTSLSSFSLIGHYQREDDSLYAARKSMLITVAGGLFLLVGFVLLYAVSGAAIADGPTYSVVAMLNHAEEMQAVLEARGLLLPALLLVAIGAAAKSAQVPLHVWLPNAMEAPTPVSAFLHSATMVKAGVFLVGRFRPLLIGEEWQILFVALGLTTMTVTAMLAVAARDVKELLAYSTASHLGLIVAGFGFVNHYGGETGAFHVLNHAVFKAALFLVAGIVAHEAGTRMLDDLGGLRHDLPVTAVVATVAGLGMAGVPPVNGFFSKELLFEAAYEVANHDGGIAWILPVVAVFGSIFTFMYSIRFISMFYGDRPDGIADRSIHRPPLTMLAPPVLLAAIALGIGLRPQLAVDALIGRTFEAVTHAPAFDGEVHFEIGYPTTIKPSLVMSAITIGLGAVGYTQFGTIRDAIRDLLAVDPLRVDFWYDGITAGANAVSTRTVDAVQTGLLRTYATWAVGTFSALTLLGYAATHAGFPGLDFGPGITIPIFVVLVLAVLAAVAVGTAPSHVAGVLTLSIVGFMIAIFYILASAPDLALTQLLIETLVLVIFLLVLDRLPAFYGQLDRLTAARDAVVATFVGLTVFITVAESTTASPSPDLRYYLVDKAGLPAQHGAWITDFGGGSNVVNVILVDFRAFDTMGEISVIAMAALSVLTLIGMRERGETQ